MDNFIGVPQQGLASAIERAAPTAMAMGTRGMADMGEMAMPLPPNTLPMMTGTGQFGPIEMGGMFTVVKVREDLAPGDYRDPGWYRHPQGSVAYAVDADSAGAPLRRLGRVPPGRGVGRTEPPTRRTDDHMNKTLARLSLAACLLCTTLALAHEGATGVVKERMDLMKRQQNDLKLIGEMAKGKTPFDADKAAEAARDVGATAKKIHELFPEGSAVHPSDALPAIWTEWDRFTGNADALANTANGLAATLENSRWPRLESGVSEADRRLQILPPRFPRQEDGARAALMPLDDGQRTAMALEARSCENRPKQNGP